MTADSPHSQNGCNMFSVCLMCVHCVVISGHVCSVFPSELVCTSLAHITSFL